MNKILVFAISLVLGWSTGAEDVDFTEPFEPDKDTLHLFHLDDVAGSVVKNAVAGGKTGRVDAPSAAEGKFGGALSCDGSKGWADIKDLARDGGLTALTVECWVKFRERARGDVVCRGGQYMIRASGTVHAYFWIDGSWRIVRGMQQLPGKQWIHLAITWDQKTKKASIYVNGRLDASELPQGVTKGRLGSGDRMMRLGGHTWQSGASMLNGELDEVRVSSIVRPYAGGVVGVARSGEARMAGLSAAGGHEALLPWSKETHPTDVAKSHREEVIDSTHTYTITQGGTMDGRNCQTRMGCGMNREGACFQTWESNRSVRMENIGNTDVINPWLSNHRNNFRSVDEIVDSATTPDMTDSEKAFAIWFQQIRYRHHSGGDNNELGDPVKVFNIYGYNTCGNDSICLGTLWKAAGFKTAPARALGHCISQVYYDSRWHLFDGDLHSVYLLHDNETVASDRQIARDHDLVKRTHSKGILMLDTWWDGPGVAALYFTETEITGERAGKADTTMDMVLRPGEAITWRWGHLSPLKYHGELHTVPTYPDRICNGLWEYRPDFTGETWRKGVSRTENIVSGPDGLRAEEGKAGRIEWTMRSPYVFVGGRIEGEGKGARFFTRQEGRSWRPTTGNLDEFFRIVGPASYRYEIRCEMQDSDRLKRLAIVNDLQMAPMALPEMVVGENTFTYSDESSGGRKVRITHRWVERSATRPPAAPEVLYPPDRGRSDGTDIVFRWTVPEDPDGDGIKDYQFELSRRPDMRFPLSMDFYKLSSRTEDAPRVRVGDGWQAASVKPQYTLSEPGRLTPGTEYYWRVRAMDDNGLWGRWSKTGRFTAGGPAYPVDVRVDFREAEGTGIVRWKPYPIGRRPARYRVYGSDEKGFTIGDSPYPSVVGATKEEMAEYTPHFPANLIAETTETQLRVLGVSVDNPAANKTYYRVVAVDENGKRSGPSDYATAPRPVVYGRPIETARVGQQYRYHVRTNRSLGHLSARIVDRRQISGYWDIEKPTFELIKGPPWLTIDKETGVLSGVPDAPGTEEVELKATIDRTVRKVDESKLVWGHEKVLEETTERIGTSMHKFTVEVEE